jgi:hypothetical protein
LSFLRFDDFLLLSTPSLGQDLLPFDDFFSLTVSSTHLSIFFYGYANPRNAENGTKVEETKLV